MSRLRVKWSLLSWIVAAACASSTAYQGPPVPPPGGGGGTTAGAPGELPPFTFAPRPIEPRQFPVAVPASFSALPKMTTSGKCVAAGAVPEGKPRPVAPPKPKKVARAKPRKRSSKGPAGFVPYDSGEGGATAASTAAPAREAEQKAASQPAPPPAAEEAPAADFAADEAEPSAAPEMVGRSGGGDLDDASDVAVAKNRAADRKERRRAKRDNRKAKKGARSADASAPLGMDAPATEAPPVEIANEDPALAVVEPEFPPIEEGWGEATFLSNDDTMSLSSAQRVISAIDRFEPIAPQDVRPHELLNYFSFQTAEVEPGHDFAVHAEIAPSRRKPGLYSLALAVNGRPVGRQGRRNAVITLVIDRSGSMRAEGRMEYLKRGLLRMVRELKDGDIVHVVTFDHRVCTPLSNFVVGRDDTQKLIKTIHGIKPSGSTNLHAGLTRGYTLADNTYQPKYTNRVILITDALANTGVTDPRTMSMVSDFFDARRIRLTGIGVGRTFNDALLDRLTETGRGAYVYLGDEAEVDAVFGDHFTSMIETTANDTHFRLHLPPTLRIQQFHGEESSTVKSDVQAVHFFADTSQLFFTDLEAWQGQLRPQDDIMLEIEYLHPETGQQMVEEYAFNLGEISQSQANVHKAELVTQFIEGVQRQAFRGVPRQWSPRAGTWRDAEALTDCANTRADLAELAPAGRDPEVARIVQLWDGYCARFEGQASGRPPRKDVRSDRWPAARGSRP